jgi:hypothetical protein
MYSYHFRIIYRQFFSPPFGSNLLLPLKLKNCRTKTTILEKAEFSYRVKRRNKMFLVILPHK